MKRGMDGIEGVNLRTVGFLLFAHAQLVCKTGFPLSI
jgi:hypothetical protein